MDTTKECSVEGCSRKAYARGWCGMHYQRWHRDGDLGDAERTSRQLTERPLCAVEGCDRQVRSRGWCDMHYQRWLTHGDPEHESPERKPERCAVEGCDRPVSGRGWCSLHYGRWRTSGDVRADQPPRPAKKHREPCSVEGCDRPVKARGWCAMHYANLRERPECSEEGCARPARTRGLCEKHYGRLRAAERRARQGPPTCARCSAEVPWDGTGRPRKYCELCIEARLAERPLCAVEGCGLPVASRGWCSRHYARWQRTGDPGPAEYLNRGEPTSDGGYRSAGGQGYIRLWFPDPENPGQGRRIMEHRYVMEQILGRELLPEENVHHVNGDRSDNRPENLELWSTMQPSGQRVADKLAWARELLDQYADAPDEAIKPRSNDK